MKKLSVICMFALLMVSIVPVQSYAAKETETKEIVLTAAQTERANQITARLNQIYAMDKSNLSSSEKKALRKEVRAMKKESTGNGGIYLSIGAIIIIILLLILIL